jgi:hypothetical protein
VTAVAEITRATVSAANRIMAWHQETPPIGDKTGSPKRQKQL